MGDSSSRCRPKSSERQAEGESDELQRGLLKFPCQLPCSIVFVRRSGALVFSLLVVKGSGSITVTHQALSLGRC